MATRCSATVRDGDSTRPCRAWAVHETNPPLCSAHGGGERPVGAPEGNTNAVTHGFYQKHTDEEKISETFDLAQNVTLIQEAVLIRVVLRRLVNYMGDKDTPPEKIIAVAPLIFTGSKTLAYLEKHLPDPNALDWNAALDQLGEEWGWDL